MHNITIPTIKEMIKLNKRFLSTVVALVFLLGFTSVAFAATTETFYGGYSNSYSKGSIVVDLTNISYKKNVILSETEAGEYFDNADSLNMVMDYDYDMDEEITIKDILAYYNNYNGGVPTYYADTAPVVVTAKTAMRTFYFSYKGDIEKHIYEPKYYSFDEYFYNFDNKQVYTQRPEDWLFADGTTAILNEPGKYIFVVTDDGLDSSSFAGIFCVHIGDTTSETQAPKNLNEINVKPTNSKVLVNGKVVEFEAYNINGNNYFKLRDIAKAFDIGVTWDGVTNTIGIDTSISYVEE